MEPDTPFHPVRVVAREDAGGGLTRVVLEPAPDLAAGYAAPGQYVEMRTGQARGFFVLSSEPGTEPWKLVMRSGGGASDVVLTMPVPSSVEVTGAMGPGFPMADLRGRPLIVALGGTGIAAGPPIVGRRIREGDAMRTRVFVGVRVAGDVPLARELQAWRRAGADVSVVAGFLHDPVGAALAGLPGAEVFAVGAPAMVDALRELAPDRVHTNH